MMKNAIVLFLAASLFLACNNSNNDKKVAHVITAENDTLSYRYDSVKVLSNNLVKPEINSYADTANAVVKYPVFDKEELNNFVKQQVFDFFKEDDHPNAYEDIASSFIRKYNQFYLENRGTAQWWYLLIDIKVMRQLHNYVALKYINASFVGGAHGSTYITFINFNPKTSTVITLDSLISPDKKAALLKVAEQKFRKDEGISATEPLKDRYFFTDGKFSLPAAFYVSSKGLTFLYNQYEIKPYASGITELTIPFDQLNDIAKPQTILTPTP